MLSRKVVITNPTGLHLRPAGLFCKTAMRFQCSVKFSTPKGEDEAQALEAMVTLVESGIGE